MKALKQIIRFILLVTIMAGIIIFYTFRIEPYRMKVNEYTLNEQREDASQVTIIQISDLHIKEDFTYKSLDKYIKEINAQKPDIVLFTGDLYDNYASYNDDTRIIEQFQKIEARYAKIAIWGNRDYGGGAVRQFQRVMENGGFTLLKNENWYITLENGKNILFTGLDDALLGSAIMPDDTKIYDAEYEILLAHEPDTVDNYAGYSYDLVLSGHSHGGQVDIPFLPVINDKAVEATALSSKYSQGMYILDKTSKKRLYVNTGIGTTHISARFGVVPEIALFRVYI